MRFQARKGSPWMPSSRAGSDLAGVLFLILWNFSLLCNCYRFLLLKKKKRREPVWSRRAAASRRESCRSRDCKVQACHPVPSKKSEPTEARAGLPGEIGRSQRSRWRILSLRSAAESHGQRSASPSLEGLPRRLHALSQSPQQPRWPRCINLLLSPAQGESWRSFSCFVPTSSASHLRWNTIGSHEQAHLLCRVRGELMQRCRLSSKQSSFLRELHGSSERT